MKSIVCMKRVPDSETRVTIAPDGRSLDSSGVKYVMNPYDEFALEEALARKEAAGEGSVTVVTLGPEAAKETLRSALAMGADEALLLRADPPADGLVVARALPTRCAGASSTCCCSASRRSTTTTCRCPPWWPSCSSCRARPS